MDGARRNTSDTAEHALRGVDPSTDYGADEGEPIYAIFAGIIGEWWSDTGGNTIQVRGAGRTMVGQHLSAYAVSPGQWVAEGQLIGYVGSTGSATDGPHLHWWVEDGGTRISGETYMFRAGLGYTAYGSRTPNTTASGGDYETIGDQLSAAEVNTILAAIAKLKDAPRILKTGQTIDGKTSDSKAFFDGPGGIKHIANQNHLGLLQRYLNDDTAFFYPGEWGVINSYLTAPAPSVDPAPLSAAVTKAVTAALATVKVTVDEAKLAASVAAAVDATLADDFASVKATIPKGFTITPIKG